MHNLQASLVTDLVNVMTVGACVLGVGFMLRFLLALTKERKTSLAGFRVEYRVNSALPSVTVQVATQPDRSEREYDRGEFLSGIPQALKEVALTREIRFTGSSWQETNRA